MAVEVVTVDKRYAKYFVEKVDYTYEEDNSVITTVSYYSLVTKNDSVGLAPDFDPEKWETVESIPEEAKKLKDVIIQEADAENVSTELHYFYEWYTEEEQAIQHVKGVCVHCKYHTTENPNLKESILKAKHKYICEGQQVEVRVPTEGHYCTAYVNADYIEGKDVFDYCTKHNSSGECVKFELASDTPVDPDTPDEPVDPDTPDEPVAPEAPVISCAENLVTITCATEDAVICYTTDGTEPSMESTLYIDPFEITETTTVKAIAVKDNLSSDVVTEECEFTE